MENMLAANTDKEIWRRVPDDYYSPSIHVTENGDIGINVGGYVLVAPIEKWHKAGEKTFTVKWPLQGWEKIIYKIRAFLFRRLYLKNLITFNPRDREAWPVISDMRRRHDK